MSRAKKNMPAMLPQKVWLTKEEAMSYTGYSYNDFLQLVAAHNVAVSKPTPGKTFYNVNDINKKIFEAHRIA